MIVIRPERLPDAANFFWGFDHGLAGAAGKGFGEFRHVGDDAVDAVFGRGMRIGLRADSQIFRTVVGTIPLSEADEEALLWGEAVDGLEIFAGAGRAPGHVRQDFSAEVGDVFAFGQFPVDVHVLGDHVLRILVTDAFGALVEFFAVGFGPPGFQIAFGVELAAFVVEAVGEFVADGAAGVAVIWRVVDFGIVKRGLENSGGKIDVVHLRIVVGVNGGGRDLPLAVIDWLADFADVAAGFKSGGALNVAEKIGFHNFYRAIVAPAVRVANFVANAGKLGECLLFGFRAHPVERLNALGHGVFDMPDHFQGALLELRRKNFADVGLAEGFAQHVVGELNAAFPLGLLLFLAVQVLAIKLKILLDESGGEKLRGTVGEVKAQVGLPIGERFAGQHAVGFLEKIGNADVENFNVGVLERAVIDIPVEIGREILQAGKAHFVF